MYWFAVNTKLNLAIYEVKNAFESQQFSAFFLFFCFCNRRVALFTRGKPGQQVKPNVILSFLFNGSFAEPNALYNISLSLLFLVWWIIFGEFVESKVLNSRAMRIAEDTEKKLLRRMFTYWVQEAHKVQKAKNHMNIKTMTRWSREYILVFINILLWKSVECSSNWNIGRIQLEGSPSREV